MRRTPWAREGPNAPAKRPLPRPRGARRGAPSERLTLFSYTERDAGTCADSRSAAPEQERRCHTRPQRLLRCLPHLRDHQHPHCRHGRALVGRAPRTQPFQTATFRQTLRLGGRRTQARPGRRASPARTSRGAPAANGLAMLPPRPPGRPAGARASLVDAERRAVRRPARRTPCTLGRSPSGSDRRRSQRRPAPRDLGPRAGRARRRPRTPLPGPAPSECAASSRQPARPTQTSARLERGLATAAARRSRSPAACGRRTAAF